MHGAYATTTNQPFAYLMESVSYSSIILEPTCDSICVWSSLDLRGRWEAHVGFPTNFECNGEAKQGRMVEKGGCKMVITTYLFVM